MRQGLERGWRAGAAVMAALLLVASPAVAGTASSSTTGIAWSTYLRSGPGETYAAIAELEHDTPVRIVGCSGGWCRVSAGDASGYVDRDALSLPRTLAPQPPATTDCVVVGQADNRGPIPTRFCSSASRGR